MARRFVRPDRMTGETLSVQDLQALRRDLAEASASIRAARRLAQPPEPDAPAPFDPFFDQSLERLEQALERLDRCLLPDQRS